MPHNPSQAERVEFLHLLESLELQIDPPSTAVIWHDVIHLAQQCGLTAYDAATRQLGVAMLQG